MADIAGSHGSVTLSRSAFPQACGRRGGAFLRPQSTPTGVIARRTTGCPATRGDRRVGALLRQELAGSNPVGGVVHREHPGQREYEGTLDTGPAPTGFPVAVSPVAVDLERYVALYGVESRLSLQKLSGHLCSRSSVRTEHRQSKTLTSPRSGLRPSRGHRPSKPGVARSNRAGNVQPSEARLGSGSFSPDARCSQNVWAAAIGVACCGSG